MRSLQAPDAFTSSFLESLALEPKVPLPEQSCLTTEYQPDLKHDEQLNSRYTLVKKLAKGVYASVWLATDAHYPPGTLREIKVLSYKSTLAQGDLVFDRTVARIINNAVMRNPKHPGSQHVQHILHHFVLYLPRSEHLCLVSKALGRSLCQLKAQFDHGALPVSIIRRFTRQLLQALAFLHDECDIVHTGMSTVFVNDDILIDEYGAERAKESEIDFVLIDFSFASPVRWGRDHCIQPEAYRSPEVLLGLVFDHEADIWYLGCVVFELLTGTCLFPLYEKRSSQDDVDGPLNVTSPACFRVSA
ncbi:kinase-like protein [Peniophora sp. CONT]|nr:kinase-like protein [Peniophora sp. CONT]